MCIRDRFYNSDFCVFPEVVVVIHSGIVVFNYIVNLILFVGICTILVKVFSIARKNVNNIVVLEIIVVC
jgi:hypothetical protein